MKRTDVADPGQSDDLITALTAADRIAVDTEFMRETTFWPILCLIQIAGPSGEVLIDPLALCTIALTGTVMSVTWYLTFFPPAAYLRYVGHAPGEGDGTSTG